MTSTEIAIPDAVVVSGKTEAPRVVKDGKVAVLVSPGFGAGFVTWIDGLALRPTLVQYVLLGKRDEITPELVQALTGLEYACTGGASDLEIEWVEKGLAFRYEEYDGSEHLVFADRLYVA